MQCKLDPEQSLKDIPKKQKQAPIKPLDYFVNLENTQNENMALAYLSGHYTLEQVGSHFGVSYATVSRAVKQKERGVDWLLNVECKAWPYSLHLNSEQTSDLVRYFFISGVYSNQKVFAWQLQIQTHIFCIHPLNK